MSQTHEAPRRQTLRQRELQGYHALFVGRQLGIEEGCLVQVLTHLYILSLTFVCRLRVVFCCSLIGNSCIRHHHLLHHHRWLLHHHHVISNSATQALASHHASTPKAMEAAIVERWIYVVVEGAEHQVLHFECRPASRIVVSHLVIAEIAPIVAGQRQIDIRYQSPLVVCQHVETLIIECSHHLGVYWFALWVTYGEGPLFLLTWFQTITEGFPL